MSEPIRELMLSDHHGIYIPFRFVTRYAHQSCWGLTPKQVRVLKAGPYGEGYWDVWDEVLRDSRYTDHEGATWSLEQDGDLWAVNLATIGDEPETV